MTPDHARDLDELLHAARSGFIARSDASFDFDAGLADVRQRADLLRLDQELSAADSAPRPRRRQRDDGPPRSLRADGC